MSIESSNPSEPQNIITLHNVRFNSGIETTPPTNCRYTDRDLLLKLKMNAELHYEMHTLAAKHCHKWYIILTTLTLMFSLICAVISPILLQYTAGTTFSAFSSSSFAFIGGTNLVFNNFSYSSRTLKHNIAKDEYSQIVDLLDIALTQRDENPCNIVPILTEVQLLKKNLIKFTPQLPEFILDKYNEVLLPYVHSLNIH